MQIDTLYEDSNVLVINKPAGISVHPDGKGKEGETISEWFAKKYPKAKNVGEPLRIEDKGKFIEIKRSGVVHRLDKETSGALILAKNQKTFDFLKEQFEEREVEKVYQAFVYGYVKDPKASLGSGGRGIVNAPIGRSPNDVRMWTAGRGAREPIREALTQYEVLSRFTDTDDEKEAKKVEHQFSYIEARPKTGRTHQIRVHMRYINHSVVSDPIYAGSKEKALGMKRLALHAKTISFALPNGKSLKIEAPLPDDFKRVIKKYKLEERG